MRLHDRHLTPVSGISGLAGVRYRVHEDEDSVDDSDYSLADEGEAEHQRPSKNKQRRGRQKPVQRKALPDRDDESVSSEDGSFFTLKSSSSTLASGEILIQQLSFESDGARDGIKHSVVLTTSPNITKGDDMLMSDDDDDFQEHNLVRIQLDPIPVLDAHLMEDFDDNSSTMSSLLGEEHLFIGRTESNASLTGFGAPDNRDTFFKDQTSSKKASHSFQTKNIVHRNIDCTSPHHPPLSATLSTDSFSSDDFFRSKGTKGCTYTLKHQRPRDRLDSAVSSSSIMFNYSDGEASLSAQVDPKSQNLLQKRRSVDTSNQTRPTDGNKETDDHDSPNKPSIVERNIGTKPSLSHKSASVRNIPDNDIPAIKSLATGSSLRDSTCDSKCVEYHLNQQSIEKDVSIGPDLFIDDIDWEATADHSFTTVDTPPFFTISIPKNWKQQEENKDQLKKKGTHEKFRTASKKEPKDLKKGRSGNVSESIPQDTATHNGQNRGRSISFRVLRRGSSAKRHNERGSVESDRSRSHSLSKPQWSRQFIDQDAEKVQTSGSKSTSRHAYPDSNKLLETRISKLSSIGDDNRSVSSHHTFWSTQSDGLIAQRRVRDTSINIRHQEDNAKDDNKSVQTRNSFSSFRSFFSTRSWKASNRRKSRGHRSHKATMVSSKDRQNRWTWFIKMFVGKKENTHSKRHEKKNCTTSAVNLQQLDEDMTSPTAEMSDLSFLSNNLNETSMTDNEPSSIIGRSKHVPSNSSMESSKHRSLDILDRVKLPKPTLHRNAQGKFESTDFEGMFPVSQNHDLNVMIYQSAPAHGKGVSRSTGSSRPRTENGLVVRDSRTFEEELRRKAVTKDANMKAHEKALLYTDPVARDARTTLVTDEQNAGKTNNQSAQTTMSLAQPRSRLSDHHHNRINAYPQSAKAIGSYTAPIPKPPPSHQRRSSVESSRSLLSNSSRDSVRSNASSTSRGSVQSKTSMNSVVTESSQKSNVSGTNAVIIDKATSCVDSGNRPRSRYPEYAPTSSGSRMNQYPRKSVYPSENSMVSNSSHLTTSSTINPEPSGKSIAIRSSISTSSRRSIQSSGSSVVSRESQASMSSTISRGTAGSLASSVSKKSISSKSSVATSNSAQSWSSRGSWETVSARDPCARPSKIVRNSSHLQQLTEKGDGDVWVERLYKSKRSGEYKVYFVSTNTGKRSRDEPPSGASKVIYRDYDARFH